MACTLVAALVSLGLAACGAMPATPVPSVQPEAIVTPNPTPESTGEPQAMGPAREPVTPSPPPPTPPSASPTGTPAGLSAAPTGESGGQPLPPDPALALLVTVARADLANRLKVTEGDITLVSAQQTEMPAGSLGCGEAEERENHGIILGTEIVLAAGGAEYSYRSDDVRLVPCSPDDFPGGHAPIFVTGAGLPRMTRSVPEIPRKSTASPPDFPTKTAGQQQPAVASAIADLAARLKVPETQIAVSRIEEVEWRDASLGCPQPGMMYAQVITPGYRIVLQADGKTYEYHASETHAVLCRQG